MIKINTTLFDLDDIFTHLTHAKTWELTEELRGIKDELLISKRDLLKAELYTNNYVEEMLAIDHQLWFLDINLKTLEEALLCHESKISERSIKLGTLGSFWLN